jgi:hypothetical protein
MQVERIEKKFIYNEDDEYFNFFLMNALFKKMYNTRIVNSIYFDTFSHKNVWDNINGFSNRKKIRVRWYNKIKNSDVFIEIKEKKNFVTKKKVQKLGKFSTLDELNLYFKSDVFLNHEYFDLHKENLNQTIQIQYEREYYISTNNKLRITIDRKIKISKDQKTMLQLDDVILEIKYNISDSDYVNQLILNYKLNNRNRKYSKYVNSFLILNESGLL